MSSIYLKAEQTEILLHQRGEKRNHSQSSKHTEVNNVLMKIF